MGAGVDDQLRGALQAHGVLLFLEYLLEDEDIGGPETQPAAVSQVSGPLQALPSELQTSGGPETQPRAVSQDSGPLQTLPSELQTTGPG